MIGRFLAIAITLAARCRPLSLVGSVVALVLAASSVSAATGWTGPRLVGPAANCTGVAAAIDADGGYHVVAECDGRIRYSKSTGGWWSTTYFAHPLSQTDHEPQIAIDGSMVYVAYSRESFAGCGFSWAGVYYRKRTLPGGAWSAATFIGHAGDHLQSLRVVGGTIHATVDNANVQYQVAYETSAPGIYHRYVLTDAVASSSLRIGSDGRARIVYQAGSSLRYAVFNGSGFTRSTIPGTSGEDRRPVLVLDASNAAHVLWTHEPGPGCAIREPLPEDGTYYATNRGGAWTPAAVRRMTTDQGAKSLNVDVATGRVYALVGGDTNLTSYTKTASGPWTSQKLSSARVNSCTIRLDPSTGTLLAVYAREVDFDAHVSGSVFSLTKP